MAKASSFSPLQLASPIQLIFCLILFFLPWVELQCVPPKQYRDMPKEQLERVKKEMGVDPTKTISYATQSGFQIASGEASPGSDIKKMSEGKGSKGKLDFDGDSKGKKEDGSTAPLLYLYPVALIAGIVIAFVPIPGNIRRLVLAGCCLLGFGVIGLQALIGFPIEKKLKELEKEKGGVPAMGGFGGGGGDTTKKSDAKEESPFRVAWKLPLYLTFLLLLGAAGTAFIVPGGGAKGRKKPYGYDDDDDDEDDDRPKKKKRRDDDDDEDDRPKKKKPMSLDDEDDRPAKKKRRDEDDEDDDRPRKKRRDDDEDDEPPPKKKPAAAAPPTFNPPAAPAPKPSAPAAPAGGNPFAFDDGDDAPPKKKPKRRDDDDEDDDRPRKKKRRDDDD